MNTNYLKRSLVILAVTAAITSGFASTEAAANNFWVVDAAGQRITHDCRHNDPMELCMQGRRVVMQVLLDEDMGFSYRSCFYHVRSDVTNRRVKLLVESNPGSDPEILIDGKIIQLGVPSSAAFDGMLVLSYPKVGGVVVERTIYPSMSKAAVLEEWQVVNTGGKVLEFSVKENRELIADPKMEGVVFIRKHQGVEPVTLKPGDKLSFATSLQARLETDDDIALDVTVERAARRAVIEAAWNGPGRLETPEPRLDMAFALQKFHVLECPMDTIKGLITHNGSLTYSPGIWANDPVEYSSPLFPFFGDPELNRASMNMYRIWQDYCREHGIDPFPGSFEHEALKLTQKERGDDAMVLYGLAKFLLFQGDRAAAEELWPLIEYSAASVLSHTTPDSIVASETDEMEDRYPTGDANLSTSALAYGGYRLAANLARSLDKPIAVSTEFDQRADAIRKGIEAYFGAEVEGFKTYRYYAGNTTLRGWILLPLAMDITERQDATVGALISDKLWPNRMQGADILAESTRPTEWGRETYYALRVLFKAGHTDVALDLTRRVVDAQIFGSRGPYPDEDAIDMLCPGSLYPRVFTEGMFGIVPTGLNSFECTPWLPESWPSMALRDLHAFGRSWDIVVERDGDEQKTTVTSGGKTVLSVSGPAGKTYSVTLP